MLSAARIIDANSNRAREALRVLEDIARFTLDDADLSARLKNLRHDLRHVLAAFPVDADSRLAWRDTPADVGTRISTPAEQSREGLAGVAAAATARLTESLRSIEECAKTFGAGPTPGLIEQLRYRAYEIERRVLSGARPSRAPQWRLCVLVTRALCAGRTGEQIARGAIAGGADCIQLREKDLPDAEFLAAARAAREMTRATGVALVVNDRPDIAALARADGVHVGQTDLPVREVRRLAGGSLLVGVSTTNVEQARTAAADGADYCGVGPMFAGTTKAKPTLAGPEGMHRYLADPVAARLPHLAIGGITPENVAAVVRAGARGVAVSNAVCGAADPEEVCRRIRRALDTPGP